MTIQQAIWGRTEMIISFGDSPAEKLQTFLNEFASPTWESLPKGFQLKLHGVEFTPHIVMLLVQVLNQPLPQSADAAVNIDSEMKWHWIECRMCSFAQPDTTRLPTDDDESYCTRDDRNLLAWTMAHRTSELDMIESPQILREFLQVPQVEMKKWLFFQPYLSATECAWLGDLVQSSHQLKHLVVYIYILEDPYILAEGLYNAIHLERLEFIDKPNTFQQKLSTMGSVLERRHVVAAPLLQNPQSHLQSLTLDSCQLEDCHLIALAQILPASQIRSLCLNNNHIQGQGILEFARQLPRIKWLKGIYLVMNPFDKAKDEHETCYAALLQGILENYSMEQFAPLTKRPHAALLQYYMDANRAGRRILRTSDPVPAGLWALILERAARFSKKNHEEALRRSASVVYFFLRNCHHVILP